MKEGKGKYDLWMALQKPSKWHTNKRQSAHHFFHHLPKPCGYCSALIDNGKAGPNVRNTRRSGRQERRRRSACPQRWLYFALYPASSVSNASAARVGDCGSCLSHHPRQRGTIGLLSRQHRVALETMPWSSAISRCAMWLQSKQQVPCTFVAAHQTGNPYVP